MPVLGIFLGQCSWDGDAHSTDNCDGSYLTLDGGGGTITESGAANSKYHYDSSFTLGSDNTWQVSSGTGSGGGDGFAKWSYSGGGTYAYAIGTGSGTLNGTFTQSGSANTAYTYSFSATQAVGGVWTLTGNATRTWDGASHLAYSGSGSYTSGFISGTASESGSDDSSYGYTLAFTLDANNNWVGTTGSGGSSGAGAYHSSYVGHGSNVVNTPSTSGDTTTTSTLNETWDESGHGDSAYTFSTTSTFANGAWTTTGSATTTGAGVADWAYVGSSTFVQDTSSSWSDSSSSGSSSSHSQRAESSDLTQHNSYAFTTVVVLAAGGSLTTTATNSGSGFSSSHYQLNASGYSDSVSNTSGEGSSSHSEAHDTWSQTDIESSNSSWQENFTTVTSATGSITTGSASGSSNATGSATFVSHSSSFTDSSSSSAAYSSQSHSDWSSDTSTSDNYEYHASWSNAYDANGVLTSSSSATNHRSGSFSTSWVSHWSNSSTMTDPMTGQSSTTSDSGGDSSGNSSSYDFTDSTPRFAAGEYSIAQAHSYVNTPNYGSSSTGAWPTAGATTGYGADGFHTRSATFDASASSATNVGSTVGSSSNSTNTDPNASGGTTTSSGGTTTESGQASDSGSVQYFPLAAGLAAGATSDDYAWYERWIPLVPLITQRNREGARWYDAIPGAPAVNLIINSLSGRGDAQTGEALDQRRLEMLERTGQMPLIENRSAPRTGGPSSSIRSGLNDADPTFANRAQNAFGDAAMIAGIGISWAGSAGIFVNGSRFTFNMNTGRWTNTTAARQATAAEAEAAQRAAMAGAARGSRGVWDLGWAARGPAIEQRLGGNLPNGFPIIDRFQNGIATSIKSMDMVAASGGATGAQYITNTGRGYIDAVAGFQGASRISQATGATTTITSSQIAGRALDLAVPPGVSAAQRTALNGLIEYGRQRGVTVNIIELPH